jgi:hypothetical protein
MQKYLTSLLFAVMLPLALNAQSQSKPSELKGEHGTCAVALLSSSRVAFAIDSRLTYVSPTGKILGHQTGCKVSLPRPSILVATVGYIDSTIKATDGLDHWNAMEEANQAIKTLPENPTMNDIINWGTIWSKTLWTHFRRDHDISDLAALHHGVISETFLITIIDHTPFLYRTSVTWNGVNFSSETSHALFTGENPSPYFSGYCRQFFQTMDPVTGNWIPPAIPLDPVEMRSLESLKGIRSTVRNMFDLNFLVLQYEYLLTSIDDRIEGKNAVIGPPYATAQWDADSNAWKTDFNPECNQENPNHQ